MSSKNPYGVPPPWNPGYALPANVAAEGLRRRVMVTEWAPRGTFYPAPPATAKPPYATPEYIETEPQDERYTRTTAWAPRGSYWGVHGKVTPEGGSEVGGGAASSLMGVDDGAAQNYMPDPFVAYGSRAAKLLLGGVARLPPPRRAAALRMVLDQVDPTLWGRANHNASRARANGATPSQALEQGLASAMTDGMLKEVVNLGRKQRAPSRKSLLGLGCYGSCPSLLGDAVRGGTETATRSGGHADEYVQLGPFDFPIGGSKTRATYRIHTPTLKKEWQSWFAKEAVRMSALAAGWMKVSSALLGPPRTVTAASLGLDKFFGLAPQTPVIAKFFDGTAPIMKTTDPRTKEDMGVFLIVKPGSLEAWYRPMPPVERDEKPWWKKAWGAVRKVVGKVMGAIAKAGRTAAEYAKKGLDALADLGCQLVNSGAAPGAAGAGAAAAGIPPEIGARGVGIAQGLCAEPPPPVQPGPTSQTSSVLPLAIVGGGIAAILLLAK